MDKVNKTQLNIELATEQGIVHRDYLSHVLRWNYVLRFIKRDSTILDLGCGDGFLSQILYVNKYKPMLYVGIDIRKKALEKMLARHSNFWKEGYCLDIRTANFGEGERLGFYDIVVCFEVIEHFGPEYLDHVLTQIGYALKPGRTLMLSTPNYSTSKVKNERHADAANHVYEYTEEELEEAFKENGFVIDKKIGTFASQSDLVQAMTPDELRLMDELKGFLDSNILSVVFASKYPSQSRNILWLVHPEVR